jgi:hypothetical protein
LTKVFIDKIFKVVVVIYGASGAGSGRGMRNAGGASSGGNYGGNK